MRAVDLIVRKRDGGQLTPDELSWLVTGFLDGSVSEGQMGAWLMAGVLKGFSEDEARALTAALVRSGEQLDLSRLPGPTIDKHSTGGVGDSTTLLVAPLLAGTGAQLVKLSGRGLGHTGGTVDKLESIPGLRVELEPDELLRIAADVGCVVAAQTDRLVPGDRALYALRDVTGTVAAPALIASSVMAKKLAGGASTIVLDVKAGDGAFMPTPREAAGLARLCVRIGLDAGRRCVAIVSDMDQPLGLAVGNGLEVAEAVELLAAPPRGRLARVALELSALALTEARAQGGVAGDVAAARGELRRCWESGSALERLGRMVAAQGGEAAVCEHPRKVLPQAAVQREAVATLHGTVTRVPARAIGELAVRLGGGRGRAGGGIDPAAGLQLCVEVGSTVDAGDALAVVHASSREEAEDAVERVRELIAIGEDAEAADPVLERVALG